MENRQTSKNLKNNNLKIRFAKQTDLPDIISILNEAILSKTANGYTEISNIENRLNWFHSFSKNKYPIYIAEIDKKVVGYATLSPYRANRKAMQSIAEISYYVSYSFHRQGIGSALMAYVINDCNRLKINHLLAFVLSVNKRTLSILNKFNFKKWGALPNVIALPEQTCSHFIYGLTLNN